MGDKNVSYSKIASLIRNEINRVRINPLSYISYLKQKMNKYDLENQTLFYPFPRLQKFKIQTKQGRTGINQLIEFLMYQTTSVKLIWSYELHNIAHKSAQTLAKLQTKEIVSPDFTNKNEIQYKFKQNRQLEATVECIDEQYHLTYYGTIDPRQVVSQFILDDGNKNRGFKFDKLDNRKAIFSKKCNHIGIGIHEHSFNYFVIVIILANHVRLKQPNIKDQNSNCNCNCLII